MDNEGKAHAVLLVSDSKGADGSHAAGAFVCHDGEHLQVIRVNKR
jgi:hypothetical protein